MSRALSILGVISPGTAAVANPDPANPSLAKSLVPGVALGVAGYATWTKHPILGFIAGESAGMNAYRIYRNKGGDRTTAFCNMGMAGAVVTGSLMWKRHPFYGGCLGLLAGAVVTSFIPGSNAFKLKEKL